MDLAFKKEIIDKCKKKINIKGKEVIVRQPRKELKLVQEIFGSEMAFIYSIELDNEKSIPKFHLKDGKKPIIIDVHRMYPESVYGKLSFTYENGYVWLTSEKKGKLFMDMHCYTNDLNKIKEYKKNLKDKRRKPFLGDITWN